MPAKQLDPGVAVSGSSHTRTSGTTRDRAPDSREGLGTRPGKRSASLSISLTKAQGWVEAANLRVTPRLICVRSKCTRNTPMKHHRSPEVE